MSSIGFLGTSAPSAVFNDGSSQPIGTAITGPAAFYDAGTNTTWICWEGFQSIEGTGQRVVEVATFNHTTRVWKGNYIAATNTLNLTDAHGIPTIVADSSGRVYVFYGSHNTAVQISWVGNLSTGPFITPIVLPPYGSIVPFPNCFSVGTNTLYLFFNTTGTSGALQSSISVVKGTTSATGIVWGTAQSIFDTATVNTWLPVGEGVVQGTKINWVFLEAGGPPGSAGLNLYYMSYDTATGTVLNYAANHSDAIAAQPVGLTSLNANYRILTGTDLFCPQLAFDSGGNPHACVVDGGTGPNGSIIALDGSGGVFTSSTIYAYTVNIFGTQGTANSLGLVSRGAQLDLYFSDGLELNGLSTAGNIRRVTWNGSTWGTSTLIQSFAGANALDVPMAIVNGTAEARVAWTQVTNNTITVSGVLQGYIYGDNGWLQRPAGYVVLAGAGTTIFDVNHKSANITIGSKYGVASIDALATATAVNASEARVTVSKSSGKFYFELVPLNHPVPGDFGIGLVNSLFPITSDTIDLGKDVANNSIGLEASGNVFRAGGIVATVDTFNGAANIGVAVNLDTGRIWFCTGRGQQFLWNNDVIANQNPALGVGGIDISSISGPLFPAIQLDGINDEGVLNLGQLPLQFGPPATFGLCQ